MLTRVVLLVDAMFCEQATNREAVWLQDFLCNVLYEADRQTKESCGAGEDDGLVWGYQVVNGLDEKLDYCFTNHIIKPAIASCQAKPLPNLHRCSQSSVFVPGAISVLRFFEFINATLNRLTTSATFLTKRSQITPSKSSSLVNLTKQLNMAVSRNEGSNIRDIYVLLAPLATMEIDSLGSKKFMDLVNTISKTGQRLVWVAPPEKQSTRGLQLFSANSCRNFEFVPLNIFAQASGQWMLPHIASSILRMPNQSESDMPHRSTYTSTLQFSKTFSNLQVRPIRTALRLLSVDRDGSEPNKRFSAISKLMDRSPLVVTVHDIEDVDFTRWFDRKSCIVFSFSPLRACQQPKSGPLCGDNCDRTLIENDGFDQFFHLVEPWSPSEANREFEGLVTWMVDNDSLLSVSCTLGDISLPRAVLQAYTSSCMLLFADTSEMESEAVIDCSAQALKGGSRSLSLQSVAHFSTIERKMDNKREEIISTLNTLVDTVVKEQEPLEEIDIKDLEEKIQASDSKKNTPPRQTDSKTEVDAHRSSPVMEKVKFSLSQIEREYNACLQAGVRSEDSEVSSAESMLLESLSKISSHQEAMTVLQKLVIDISNLLSWRKARVEKPPDAVRQESRLPMFSIRKTLKRAKKMPNAKSQRDPPPDYSQDKETVDKELVVQRGKLQIFLRFSLAIWIPDLCKQFAEEAHDIFDDIDNLMKGAGSVHFAQQTLASEFKHKSPSAFDIFTGLAFAGAEQREPKASPCRKDSMSSELEQDSQAMMQSNSQELNSLRVLGKKRISPRTKRRPQFLYDNFGYDMSSAYGDISRDMYGNNNFCPKVGSFGYSLKRNKKEVIMKGNRRVK